jgi:hypothetical protein
MVREREMVRETEMEREMRRDGDIRRKMKTQRSTMSPASLGDADRFRCAFCFQIIFCGFFFLVRCSITYGGGCISAQLVLADYKMNHTPVVDTDTTHPLFS